MSVFSIGRPLPGTVGETRRVAHLFPAPRHYPARLTAICGQRFWSGDLEWMNEPRGMPCEICLARAPT